MAWAYVYRITLGRRSAAFRAAFRALVFYCWWQVIFRHLLGKPGDTKCIFFLEGSGLILLGLRPVLTYVCHTDVDMHDRYATMKWSDV
jgi:hypothetical protein